MARVTCPIHGVEPTARRNGDTYQSRAVRRALEVEKAWGVTRNTPFPNRSPHPVAYAENVYYNPGSARAADAVATEYLGLRGSKTGPVRDSLINSQAAMRADINAAGMTAEADVAKVLSALRDKYHANGLRRQEQMGRLFTSYMQEVNYSRLDPSKQRSFADFINHERRIRKDIVNSLGISASDERLLEQVARTGNRVYEDIRVASQRHGLSVPRADGGRHFAPNMQTEGGATIIKNQLGENFLGGGRSITQGTSGRTHTRGLQNFTPNLDVYTRKADADYAIRVLGLKDTDTIRVKDWVQTPDANGRMIVDATIPEIHNGKVRFVEKAVYVDELQQAVVDATTVEYKYYQQLLNNGANSKALREFQTVLGYNPDDIADIATMFRDPAKAARVTNLMNDAAKANLLSSGAFKALDMNSLGMQQMFLDWMGGLPGRQTPLNVFNFTESVQRYRADLIQAAKYPAELMNVATEGRLMGWALSPEEFAALTPMKDFDPKLWTRVDAAIPDAVYDNMLGDIGKMWVPNEVASMLKARHVVAGSTRELSGLGRMAAGLNRVLHKTFTVGQLVANPARYLNNIILDGSLNTVRGGSSIAVFEDMFEAVNRYYDGSLGVYRADQAQVFVNGRHMSKYEFIKMHMGRSSTGVSTRLGDVDFITGSGRHSMQAAFQQLKQAIQQRDLSIMSDWAIQRVRSLPTPAQKAMNRAFAVYESTGKFGDFMSEIGDMGARMVDSAFMPLAEVSTRVEQAAHMAIVWDSLVRTDPRGAARQNFTVMLPFAQKRYTEFDAAYKNADGFIMNPMQIGRLPSSISRNAIPFFSHTAQAVPAGIRWAMQHPYRAAQIHEGIRNMYVAAMGDNYDGWTDSEYDSDAMVHARTDRQGRQIAYDFGKTFEFLEGTQFLINSVDAVRLLSNNFRSNPDINDPNDLKYLNLQENRFASAAQAATQMFGEQVGAMVGNSYLARVIEPITGKDLETGLDVYRDTDHPVSTFVGRMIPAYRRLANTDPVQWVVGRAWMYEGVDAQGNPQWREGHGPLWNRGSIEWDGKEQDWVSRNGVDSFWEDLFGVRLSVTHNHDELARSIRNVQEWRNNAEADLVDRYRDIVRQYESGDEEGAHKRYERLRQDLFLVREIAVWGQETIIEIGRTDRDGTRSDQLMTDDEFRRNALNQLRSQRANDGSYHYD